MSYLYFVMYNAENENGNGSCTGTIEITSDKKMNTIECVNEVRNYISVNHMDGRNVVLLNWIKLRRSRERDFSTWMFRFMVICLAFIAGVSFGAFAGKVIEILLKRV